MTSPEQATISREARPDAEVGQPSLRPRIYVSSLANVNAGQVRGAWFEAATDPDSLRTSINELLARSPKPDADDWAIHGTHDFAGIELEPTTPLDTVTRLAGGLATFGAAYRGLVELLGPEQATTEAFRADYLGSWPSVSHYAETLASDSGALDYLDQLPPFARRYTRFDVAALVQDLESSGEIRTWDHDGTVHVFLGHEP